MSHPLCAPQPAMPPDVREALSPLLYLAGTLENRLDEDERERLENVLRSCLPPLREVRASTSPAGCDPFPSLSRHPVSIIGIKDEEPFLLYHPGGPSPGAPTGAIRLGPARIWAPLLRTQDALTALEKRDPVRAAALCLRGLAEIWRMLMNARRFDILIGENFLSIYRKSLLQAQALADRGERRSPA